MFGFGIKQKILQLRLKLGLKSNCTISCGGHLHNCKIRSSGKQNRVVIDSKTSISHTSIIIKGSNCQILISNDVSIRNSTLFIEHDNSMIIIGTASTFEGVNLLVSEPGQCIEIGNDCMFSHDITVRTSDSHKIMDERTGERINPPMSVKIEDHVWIGAGVTILKGSHIGEHVVVGAQSLVNKPLEAHAIYEGIPAKKIRDSITWER